MSEQKLKIRPIGRVKIRPKVAIQAQAKAKDEEEDLLAWPMLDLRQFREPAVAGGSESLNGGLINEFIMLVEMAKAQRREAQTTADKKKHGFRISSFERALASLKAYPQVLTSGYQAQSQITGIGKGIADRIQEYLDTGRIAEAHAELSPEQQVLAQLNTVTGIGDATAAMLVKHYRVTGVRDLQVKVKAGIIPVGKGGITHHIAVGLTYYNDLQQRMPWAEADAIARRLTELIREFDPKLTVIVCGSYRRQRPTCGDIDVLISRPDSTEQTIDSLGLLPKVVQQLTDQQLIVANLTSLGTTKFMGICQLAAGQLGRRIDIRCVPWVCLGAATLYFTGSGHFNVIMRYRANQRGYTLNEYGLYEYLQGQKGALIPAVTEEDIFQILRFVYLRPEEREF